MREREGLTHLQPFSANGIHKLISYPFRSQKRVNIVSKVSIAINATIFISTTTFTGELFTWVLRHFF